MQCWMGARVNDLIEDKVLPPLLHSPLLSRVQRRLFFGASLPPIDPAFSFR